MICTVAPGRAKANAPATGKMRLAAAQAKGSATTRYATTFGSVEETGRRWGILHMRCGRVLKQVTSMPSATEPIGSELQDREVFGDQGTFLCDFITSANILARQPKSADLISQSVGAISNRNHHDGAR
jgi:hypothetical protein